VDVLAGDQKQETVRDGMIDRLSPCYERFHSFSSETTFSIEASRSYRQVGYTKGMGTTDVTDDTDEEQRQISGGGFIPPFRHWGGCKAMGRIQSNLHQFLYLWDQCDPWSLSAFFDCG
jgi:hypothetical protein